MLYFVSDRIPVFSEGRVLNVAALYYNGIILDGGS